MNPRLSSATILLSILASLASGCTDEKSDGGGADGTTDDDSDSLPSEGSSAGECSDGADNDSDGDYDCNDSDCEGSPDCSEANTPGGCSDSADNDHDGLFDCDDPDCADDEACAASAYEGDDPGECDDGIDNDGDSLIDCDDSDCEGFEGCDEELDSESGNCDDGVDNDGDSLIDCDDDDCADSADCDTPPSEPVGTASNPATSCREIRDEGVFEYDTQFWINPDGEGAFEVFCSMTYEGGGWALLSHLGTCSGGTILPTVTDVTPCSYLSAERVSRIASVGTEVMLRTGLSFYDLTEVSLSLDSAAVEALRSPTGTWHNGARWSAWYWAEPTCSIEDVTGWPHMYLSCGSGDGVHWIRQSSGMYFHQRINNGGTGNGELATTWIR